MFNCFLRSVWWNGLNNLGLGHKYPKSILYLLRFQLKCEKLVNSDAIGKASTLAAKILKTI